MIQNYIPNHWDKHQFYSDLFRFLALHFFWLYFSMVLETILAIFQIDRNQNVPLVRQLIWYIDSSHDQE